MKIKFTGDFKKLIPMGYRFTKVWANNYICYQKEQVYIWKKGKDIEIADLYHRSYLVLQYLIDNDFQIQDKCNRIVINKEEYKAEHFDFDKHTDIALYLKGTTQEEMESFRNIYRTITIISEQIAVLKELYELKLIEIVEGE